MMFTTRTRRLAAATLAAAAIATTGSAPITGTASAEDGCKAHMMWGNDIFDGYGDSRQSAMDDALQQALAYGDSGPGQVLYVTC